MWFSSSISVMKNLSRLVTVLSHFRIVLRTLSFFINELIAKNKTKHVSPIFSVVGPNQWEGCYFRVVHEKQFLSSNRDKQFIVAFKFDCFQTRCDWQPTSEPVNSWYVPNQDNYFVFCYCLEILVNARSFTDRDSGE